MRSGYYHLLKLRGTCIKTTRHNVAGNGKRDGAKAEKSQEVFCELVGLQAAEIQSVFTVPICCIRVCSVANYLNDL